MTSIRQVVALAFCLATSGFAQIPVSSASGVADDAVLVQELRQAVANQQQQIEELQKDLRRRDEQFEQMKQMLEEVRALHGQPPAAQFSSGTEAAAPESTSLASMGHPVALPPPRPQVQEIALPMASEKEKSESSKWYDRINLRGYTQFRYERVLESENGSIVNNDGFSIRRARLVFSGNLNDRVSMYFQPDFASTSSGLNYGQIRDLYFDIFLDKKKQFRIRAGQSKIPYGFEILQSSSNRLALERADAFSSAVPGERDMALFLYYAPVHIRQRFRFLTESGLKGSGDYGMVAFGVYNGQTANHLDVNHGVHKVARFTYPFQIGKRQIVEAGVQSYTGRFVLPERGSATLGPSAWDESRIGASLIVYPQPFGFQAEYNVGRGPQYNVQTGAIERKPLDGGYAQFMYRRRIVGGQFLTGFVKSQYYDGGKKAELDARRYLSREQEFGVEWQMNPAVELTAAFGRANGITEDSRNPLNQRRGNLLKFQLQFNY